MRPRFSADYRTLLWVFLTALLVGVQYARPDLVKWLWWLSCYFALSCGVIAHNHNHCPTFASKGMNQLFGFVISTFYGFPVFAWIPTHNLNHHKFVNRAGDATITWRFTNKRVAWVAATYFFVSSYYQGFTIKAFLEKARAQNPSLYRRVQTQRLVFVVIHAALLALAVALHGVKLGLYTYVVAVVVPAIFALWTIMLFNYDQHVHTDPWSQNHSRSFDGKIVNFFLFNNGLHAAHHENPGQHWSELRAVHARIAPHIDPSLLQRSLFVYWFRQYFLAPFFPRLGTVQLGVGPMHPPSSRARVKGPVDVELGEAGSNAPSAVGSTA